MKKIIRIFVGIICISVLMIISSDYIITRSARGFLYADALSIPAKKAGLLLGTAVRRPDGRPNLFMLYRLQATKLLLDKEKIEYVLVSGDNSTKEYNEPEDIRAALIEIGVPEERIVLDYAGLRTLDSVIRAKEVFGQDEFIIISQEFQNERAIFIAKNNNISAIAFNARNVSAAIAPRVYAREYLARIAALIDVYVLRRGPQFQGEKIEIGVPEN